MKQKLRDIIVDILRTDSEFTAFCIDYFPKSLIKFSDTMSLEQKINAFLQSENNVAIAKCLREHKNLTWIDIPIDAEQASLASFERSVKSKLRYYIYISITKIRMLSKQLNIGNENEYLALEQIIQHLRQQQEIGTIDAPKNFIEGIIEMKYGPIGEYASKIAFFGNQQSQQVIALIGSTASLVGKEGTAALFNNMHFYYIINFLDQVARLGTMRPLDPTPSCFHKYSLRQAIDVALSLPLISENRLGFLAKVLYREPGLILATPLYVAMDD